MILLGDLNARVGCNNNNRERVIGKHGVGDLTNNGVTVINLFTHRNIHTLTWTSPDGRTQSQIDHIIINSKWRGSLQDVWVMRNADIGSDHNLLVAKMTLKLIYAKIETARNQRPDISKLRTHSSRRSSTSC